MGPNPQTKLRWGRWRDGGALGLQWLDRLMAGEFRRSPPIPRRSRAARAEAGAVRLLLAVQRLVGRVWPAKRPFLEGQLGFTLIEVMIVVAIIALLAAIAIPAMVQYKKETQDLLFMSALRVRRDTFKLYNLKWERYPAEVGPGVCPPEMTNYFSDLDWSQPTPIGGLWDWDYGQFGVTAAVSVVNPARTFGEMEELDRRFDDGQLTRGGFRLVGNASPTGVTRYALILE